MALATGTPLGSITTQDEITLEGAPNIYIQDTNATPLNNPDADGYYWGMSGTTAYPVYQLGCYSDVALGEDVTVNVVRCDTVGDKGAVQKRNYIELTLTLRHLFPLTVMTHLLNAGSSVDSGSGVEKMGIGKINNNKYWMVYMPKVYDEETGDYVLFHLHRAQFVDAWSISMTSGDNWNVSGLRLRAYADESKPQAQTFGVIVRADASAIT